ncbi:MAG: hypothetical protein FWF81_12885 [Defluviitaleaceae bacterium]|nr:hypothetical protein [Defluviitaleaceae bacterium]
MNEFISELASASPQGGLAGVLRTFCTQKITEFENSYRERDLCKSQ